MRAASGSSHVKIYDTGRVAGTGIDTGDEIMLR